MTDFRTDVRVSVSPFSINLQSKILTAGSCFADAVGLRMVNSKFNSLSNPFGVIYNPHSIHKVLRYAVHNQPLPEHTYLKNGDVHVNYDFHSELSALNSGELTYRIINMIGAVHYFLRDTNWLLLTYGTAWAYERNDTGEIVANCHKIPATNFKKSLLDEQKITDSFETVYNDLKRLNPDLRIILTVSPVRHIKDTLELNSVSKAVLRVACHTITRKFKDTEYFPAYEMMIDDLRDYRFYKSDMLHPTTEAEDYIWKKFAERYFDDDTRKFIAQWESIAAALAHKPFHPSSSAHQQFLKDVLKKLEGLKGKVNIDKEIETVKAQIM